MYFLLWLYEIYPTKSDHWYLESFLEPHQSLEHVCVCVCSTQFYVPSLGKQQIFLPWIYIIIYVTCCPHQWISGLDALVQTSPCSFVWRRFWRCLCQPLFFGALYVLRHGVRPVPGSLIAERVPHLIQGRMYVIIIFTIHVDNMVYRIHAYIIYVYT